MIIPRLCGIVGTILILSACKDIVLKEPTPEIYYELEVLPSGNYLDIHSTASRVDLIYLPIGSDNSERLSFAHKDYEDNVKFIPNDKGINRITVKENEESIIIEYKRQLR